MINAYILLTMRPGNSNNTIKEMRKIGNVEKISVVAGEYDIVVRVHVKDLEKRKPWKLDRFFYNLGSL